MVLYLDDKDTLIGDERHAYKVLDKWQIEDRSGNIMLVTDNIFEAFRSVGKVRAFSWAGWDKLCESGLAYPWPDEIAG